MLTLPDKNPVSWVNLLSESTGNSLVALMEFFSFNESRFLGCILAEENIFGLYEFCAFSKNRILHTVPKEQYATTIEEAKKAIEEYLVEQGVLSYDE